METYIAAIAAAAAAAYITWFWLLTRTLSGPRLWPLVGNLPGLFANRNRMHDWFVHNLKKTGPAFTYQTCNLAIPFIARTYGCFTITCNPRNLEHVLRTRFENYPKGPSWQAVFHDLLGEGIFNSDGDTWVVQRKTAALEFTTRSLRQAMERWANRSIKDRLWPILDAHCKKHEAVDLQDLLLRLTFDNICGLTFGKDPETLSLSLPDNPFSVAFDTATEATLERFLYPSFVWRLKKAVGLGSEKKLKESLEVVTKYMTEAIKERMEKPSDDLLSRFLKKKDSKVTTSTLQYIALNFVLAGRDTSSVALSWFFYIIMQKLDIEKKITDEIVSVLKETRGEDRSKWKEEPLGYEELDRLVYLKAALTETLRLYPSVPQDIKYVVADDVLPDGTFVPAGSSVTYPIYSLGRMEGIWGEDCLEFKPERWLVEEDGGKLRFDPGSDGYRFVTFNAGPRVCLGKELAYLQMKAIASSVLMRFKLELVPGHKVEQKMSLTLFMKNGLKVYVSGKEI